MPAHESKQETRHPQVLFSKAAEPSSIVDRSQEKAGQSVLSPPQLGQGSDCQQQVRAQPNVVDSNATQDDFMSTMLADILG